jgi:hypothetical protein
MIADRNNVRVFISSTFRDMTTEREALVKRVFPYLREVCKEHGIALIDIDLRWGIADETEGHERILDIVKSELNRAAVMISILGERFGWIPKGEYDSVTALEMYTALANPAIRLLVFQRKPSLTKLLAKDDVGSIYLPEPELEQKKLVRRLEHLGVAINPYSSIEQFASDVAGQLKEVLQEAYFKKLGNVFISYSRKDIERANRLKQLIEGFGFNVWLDLVGIAAGEEWPRKITEAIKECDVVLMLISEASVASEYCLKEIIFAKNKNKPIIGLRLDDVPLPDKVEFMLGDVQQIILSGVHLEVVASELSEGLRRQVERSREVQQIIQPDSQ